MCFCSLQPFRDPFIQVGECFGIACKTFCLFEEPKANACRLANIGAAVHVIADPGCQPPWEGFEGLPTIRPVLCSNIQQNADHRVAR